MSKPVLPNWATGDSYFITTATSPQYSSLDGAGGGIMMEIPGQPFKMMICDTKVPISGQEACVSPAECTGPSPPPLCKTGDWTFWETMEGPPACLYAPDQGFARFTLPICSPIDSTQFPHIATTAPGGGQGGDGRYMTASAQSGVEWKPHAAGETIQPTPDNTWIVSNPEPPCCMGVLLPAQCGAYIPQGEKCLDFMMDNACAGTSFDHLNQPCNEWLDALQGAISGDPSTVHQISDALAARVKANPYEAKSPDGVYKFMTNLWACKALQAEGESACDPVLNDVCQSFTRADLSQDSFLWRLCGCHLSKDQYGAKGQQCDPICSWDGVVANYESDVPPCKEGTCYLDSTSVALLDQGIGMPQLCRPCVETEGVPVACSCHINEADMDALVAAAEKKVDFAKSCAACYSYDSAGTSKQISCNFQHESFFKKYMWWGVGVGAGLIVAIVLFLVLRHSHSS